MNTVKITAGIYKGRKIATPGGRTHPMGERERIALFNMIADRVVGAKVLDAYAGSGALGIETLSRGAGIVVFVDKSQAAMRTVGRNCLELGIPEEQVAFCRDAVSAFDEKIARGRGHPMGEMAKTFPQEVEIILADPPYDDFRTTEVGKLARDYLKGGGILVLSHPGEAPELEDLKLIKSRQYAAAHISIYAKN